MESVYLKQSVDIEPLGAKADGDAPFSFLEWKQRRPSLNERDASVYYNQYVISWFDRSKTAALSTKVLIRQKYLYLLNQLQLFFSTEEKNTWYNKINLADEKELLLAIPYFAKKLKDIALYYLKLRKSLKYTKAKYNAINSSIGIEREVYNFLLEKFSSLNNELPVSLQKTVPNFDELKRKLSVEVEELYDDHQYFDHSPTVPLSSYYNLFDKMTESYFQTKGIELSSASWLFDSFSIQTSANLDTINETLTSTLLELTDAQQYGSFIQKYLAENKYTIDVTLPSVNIETYEVDLSKGNNYFYYPYGTIDTTLSIKRRLPLVSLSSVDLLGATAGATIEESDTIFVKNGNEIKAAWYAYEPYMTETKTVKATLKGNTTTSFIFPYPGYGLSGISVQWSGPSLESTKSYDYLSKEYKTAVNEAYWTQTLSSDAIESIWINNASLVDNGAKPNVSPVKSDKIFKTTYQQSTSLPKGELSGAWLYQFTTTALPVSRQTENNVFLWPYDILNKNEDVPEHLKFYSYEGACNSVSIQDLDCSYFIASQNFETADKIFKLQNSQDDIQEATECVWLSASVGTSTENSVCSYTIQDGVSLLLESGKVTKFIWTGLATEINQAFGSVSHQSDCPFVTNVPKVTATDWQKCSCKQVFFSPFGHPGNTVDEYNSHCDYICEANTASETFDIDMFDVNTWLDDEQVGKQLSNKFAWYKTESNQPSWGSGNWHKANGDKSFMVLEPGKLYYYYRANSRLDADSFPSLTVLKKNHTKNAVWIQAKKDEEGTWVSSDIKSETALYPGDIISIQKQSNTTWNYLSSVNIANESGNKGSEWSTLDYIALGSDLNTATISWPFDSVGTSQSPPTTFLNLSAILWWKIEPVEDPSQAIIIENSYSEFSSAQLQLPANNVIDSSVSIIPLSTVSLTATQTTNRVYDNTKLITFTPTATGLYAVSVSAVGNDSTHYYLDSTTIPLISVVPQFRKDYTKTSKETPSSGFLIEHKLTGWQYEDGSQGAKPYWAELYNEKDATTKQKGALTWGYQNAYVDDSLPYRIPKISSMKIQYGDVLEYERIKDSLIWNQPVTYNTFINKRQWKKIKSNQSVNSALSSIFESQVFNTVEVIPTMSATDIVLTNNFNGMPVEVYYYALNSFTWSISTATKTINDERFSERLLTYESPEPWTNLSNRFFSTIAVAPVLEDVYTEEEVGGYFVPGLLGASQFINKDYSTSFTTTELSGSFLVESAEQHVGGRGRTKQDQPTLYTIQEENQWMKEPPTTGVLAGTTKKSLTKSLQTFVPYQTNSLETSIGLVTPSSRVSPWGGAQADVWTDSLNEPKSFTGVRNVPAWAETQVLKQNELWVDSWTTDVFGNQYGLFKNLSAVSVGERRDVGGELWTKTNDQLVLPARTSLSSTFELFRADTTFYSQLTGNGIRTVDCFFNTLMLETSLSTVFVQFDYDYENAKIITVFDNIIKEANTQTRKFDQAWFFPKTKKVIVLFANLSGNSFYPELISFNLNARSYERVFPNSITPSTTIVSLSGIGGISVANVDRGCLNYNKIQKSFLITYKGTTTENKLFVVDFLIEEETDLILKNISVYIDDTKVGKIDEPPIVSPTYFDTYTVLVSTMGTIQLTATNNPTSFQVLNYTDEVSINNSGLISYNVSKHGLYHVNYQVSNFIGSNQYCLTLSAI